MSDVPPRGGDKGGASQVPDSPKPASARAEASSASAATSPKKEAPQDVVLLGPPTADGAGLHVLRAREERVEAGELRALQEGKPIVGEIVTLKPREDNPHVCDVTQSFSTRTTSERPRASLPHKGPAKVATEAYREGWEEIFGKKPTPPSAAN